MNPFKFIALLWVLHSILAISAKADSAAENLYSLFKLPRQEKPYACRFDLTFTPTEHKACEDLELKLRVTEEHLNPHDTTDPLFFDVYEKLPKACHQFQRESKNGIDAVWPCVFWGIKEALKYELLSRIQGCGTEDLVKVYRRELDLFQESCLSYLEQKVGLAKAASLQNEVCRRDEFLKFKNAVDDPTFLSVNPDLLTIIQPGYAKEDVPDYFYLLNACHKKKVKRKKTYAAPPIPKRECEDPNEKKPVADLTYKVSSVLNELAKNENGSLNEIETIKKEIAKKLQDTNLSNKARTLLNEMYKNEDYLQKTTTFYKNRTKNEISNSFLKELNNTIQKMESTNHSYTLSEQAQIPGANVKLEEKQSKAKPPDDHLIYSEHLKNVPIQQRQAILERIKKLDVPFSKPIQEKVIKNEVIKSAPNLKTREEMDQIAIDALNNYRKTKTSPLDFAEFFLQTELDSKKDQDRKKWKKTYQSLQDWKKIIQNVQEKSKNEKKNEAWQLYQISSELNRFFLKEYSRDDAQFIDCLSRLGCNCEGQTKLLTAFLQIAKYNPGADQQIAAQMFSDHIQLVEWNKKTNEVKNILTGEVLNEIIAPLYDPHILVHGYLKGRDRQGNFSASEYLLTEKKPVTSNSKTKSSNQKIKTNTRLKLPKSEIPFQGGEGYEVPTRAKILPPLKPDTVKQKTRYENPMKGISSSQNGIKQKKGSHSHEISDEQLLQKQGYRTFPRERNTTLGYKPFEVGVITHTNKKELISKASKPLIKDPKFVLTNSDDRNQVYFRDEEDRKYFLSLNDIELQLNFLEHLEVRESVEFYNSEEWVDLLKTASTPQILLTKTGSDESLKNQKEILKSLKNGLHHANIRFKIVTYIVEKNKIVKNPLPEMAFRYFNPWDEKINDENSNPVYYNSALLRSITRPLNEKISKNGELFFELAEKLEPHTFSNYIDFLYEATTNAGDDPGDLEGIFRNFITSDKLTFEVEEKGILERKKRELKIQSAHQIQNENQSGVEQEGYATEITSLAADKSTEQEPSPEQLPKSGMNRKEPNQNNSKADIKIPALHFLTLVSKVNSIKGQLNEPLFKELALINKDGKYDSIIKLFLIKIANKTTTYDFEQSKTDFLSKEFLGSDPRLCSNVTSSDDCSSALAVPKYAWNVFYDYFKRNGNSGDVYLQLHRGFTSEKEAMNRLKKELEKYTYK